ncbi:MAG: LytTR family transcriptional regulator [Bacteroidales bacterium]|nr:LytTR family transcriptional regulator [Bacteroidales bacterium]
MELTSQVEKPLFIKSGRTIKRISGNDILYVACEGNISTLHLKDGTQLSCVRLLKLFEQDLADLGFVRISHNCLVNLAEVEEIQYINARKRMLVLSGGEALDVSYRKWKNVKEALLGR